MAGTVFGVFCLLSVLCACLTGNTAALGDALFSGADSAVTLTLSCVGAMCLWCGILEVLREMGAAGLLSSLLSPLLSRLFPCAAAADAGITEIAASVTANLLGIGNAATPFGLRAMERLRTLRTHPERMHDEEILFVLLNTAPPTLLPTTLLSLRHAAGSADAAAVLPAVLCVSFIGAGTAAAVSCLLRRR